MDDKRKERLAFIARRLSRTIALNKAYASEYRLKRSKLEVRP